MPTTFFGSPPTSSITRGALESDAPFGRDRLRVTLAVGDDDARAVTVLDAGGDERDRVPHQVDEGVPLLLALRAGLARPDQLRAYFLGSHTGRDRRAQVRRPPMLVAAVCAVPEDRLEQHVRRRQPALTGPYRC